MKIATHVLNFGQDRWIMKNLENAYSHVDRIYVAYSEYPWNYNVEARKLYHQKFDLKEIFDSPFKDKVTVIQGVWDKEEDQRNACVDAAKKDGMNFLIIHDADEFYRHSDFNRMVKVISENPQYSVYRCPWYNFWKSFGLVTINENGNTIAGYPDICINIGQGVRFKEKRNSETHSIKTIEDIVCYHASFVLTDEEVKRKLETWGHTNDFDTHAWYQSKWLNWTENSTGLHPIQPNAWWKAVKFDGELPEVLRG